jgi:hypothetical protein
LTTPLVCRLFFPNVRSSVLWSFHLFSEIVEVLLTIIFALPSFTIVFYCTWMSSMISIHWFHFVISVSFGCLPSGYPVLPQCYFVHRFPLISCEVYFISLYIKILHMASYALCLSIWILQLTHHGYNYRNQIQISNWLDW